MNVYEIIKKKRDGLELSGEEIKFLVDGFVKGRIPDYQMAAFLMAVYYRSMNARECCDLTRAMAQSGETVDLSEIDGFNIDKHSTGGVGDTTTLVLAPLVAASGGIVAKMSGRELGHTGGTVDKLESIPGMQVELPKDKFVDIVNDIHVSVIAQTANLAPADKQIYALRNETATVDSIPLIASSIMSKKLAAGADGIVLDVKTGAGAFMQKYEDAVELAKTMVYIGECEGKKVQALITGMEQPLGNAIGNAVEVKEAIDTLNGNGPRDLKDLVLELGSMMLVMSGIESSPAAARRVLETNIARKKGLNKLAELIQAQGGNPDVIADTDLLPQPKTKIKIISEVSGFIEKINALEVGMAARTLGASRKTKTAPIDLSVGILLKKKVGDRVKKGETLAVFYSDGDRQKIDPARAKFLRAYTIGGRYVEPPRLFYARVSANKVAEFSAS
jgi:pyrimidine-nucleoside phosphorylase